MTFAAHIIVRHRCFKSGNILKIEYGLILLSFVTALCLPYSLADTQKRLCWSKCILQGACPCLRPATVLRQMYSTGSMPLLTPSHSLKTYVFYRGMPSHSLEPTNMYSTGSMPLLTPSHSLKTYVFYREHALAYVQPQS